MSDVGRERHFSHIQWHEPWSPNYNTCGSDRVYWPVVRRMFLCNISFTLSNITNFESLLNMVKWGIAILLEILLRWWLLGLFSSKCSESSGGVSGMGPQRRLAVAELNGSHWLPSLYKFFFSFPETGFLPEWSNFMVPSLTLKHLADVVKKVRASGSIMPHPALLLCK